MSDDLGTARLTTEVDLSGLESGLGEAEATTQGRLGGLADTLKGSLGLAFAGIGVALVGALAGVGVAAVDIASQFNDAQNQMQAQLGVTADEAAALGDVARGVFGNNFGDSVEDVTQSLIETRQQMKALSDEELQGAAEKALALRDAFGFGVAESTSAANTLMTKFGLTSQQAFDFIAKGQQEGLNTSGDFLETIGEYGGLMADNGFEADAFFSLMESGLQGGVLGTDKAIDAFKEFGIRIQAAGDELVGPEGALRGLLPDAEINRIFDGLADGSVTVADAYSAIAPVMAGMDDVVHQNALGVALFGTQWEDMGADAMLALSTTTTSMADMGGATDSLNAQYNNLGAVWEGVSRGFLLALEPVGVMILDLANAAMPTLLAGAESLRAGIEIAIGFIGPFIQGAVSFIGGLLGGEGASSLTGWGAQFEAMRAQIDTVVRAVWAVVGEVIGLLVSFWAENGAQISADTKVIWDQVYSTVSGVLALVSGIVTTVVGVVGGILRTHGDDIKAIFMLAWNNIKATVEMVTGVITGIVQTVSALMRGDWEGALNGIKTITDSVFNGVSTIISNVADTIKTVWANNADAIKAKTGEVFDGLKGQITGALDGVIGAVTGLAGRFADAGRALIDSLRDGIMDTISGLIDDARKALQALADLLPGSEPRDPSSPLRGLGARGAAFATNFGDPLLAGLASLNLRPALDGLGGQLDAALGGTLGGAAATANASVQVGMAPGGEAWLRNLIRVETVATMNESGRSSVARRKLG